MAYIKMNYKLIYSVIFTTLILSLFSVEASETHNTIPKIFQGKWTSNLKNCGIDNETNLEIFKDHLSFYESNGPTKSIVTKQKNELALIIELTGEGEKWILFVNYKINSKNNRLTDITDTDEKNKLIRYKCK